MGRKGENIFHRKDGRWEARYVRGYRLDGKCQYGYLYGKTYQEVKNKRNELILKQDVLQEKKKKSSVLFQEKIEQWLKKQKISVKLSTYSYYSSVVYKHISPLLGNITISQIHDGIIVGFIEKLIHDNHLKNSTLHEVIGVLKQILDFCDIPVKIKLPKREKRRISVFNTLERDKLENYIGLHLNNISIGILLSLYAGLRIGEVCALKWEDVHYNSGVLQVSKTVSRVRNLNNLSENKTVLVLTSAKTENSIRFVPINNQLMKLLKNYQTTHHIGNSCFILSNSSHFMDPRTYYNKFKAVLKSCDLEKYNYHSLRHTFATNCIEKGLDPKSLSEILGHSNIQITLSLYVHPDMEQKKKFMNHSFLCPNFLRQNSSQK